MDSQNFTADQKMKSVVFFIEANSFEQLMLWEKHHKTTEWKKDGESFIKKVGIIGKKKKRIVAIDLRFATLWNKRICFYFACSRFVDHNLVEKYLRKNFPVTFDNCASEAFTDATNFHLVINALKPSGVFKEILPQVFHNDVSNETIIVA